MAVRRERHLDVVAVVVPRGDTGVGVESQYAPQPLTGVPIATLAARAGIAEPQRRHVDIADHS